MKILYLGYFCTDELFGKIENAGLSPSVARQKFEKAMLSSLIRDCNLTNDDLEIISYLPYNNSLQVRPLNDSFQTLNLNYVWTTRNNLFQIIRANQNVKKIVKKWILKNKNEEKIILTYATNPILLFGLKSIIKDIKIITLCSEVPIYRNMTDGNRFLNYIKKRIFMYFNNKMDGYIFFSKHMNEVCNKKSKPWIVVEGMVDIEKNNKAGMSKHDNFVLYAGGIHNENGIDVLLDAISMIRTDILFYFCGEGNCLGKLIDYSNSYENIKYLGTLSNKDILELEKKALLLINPRKNDFILSKYSFPSKTFEYFSSGTPCMMTRLDGIPDEYYNYCYECDVTSPELLASDLNKFFNIPEVDRYEKALKAYEFVKNEKSSKAQTKKIFDFLCGIIKE